MANFPKIDQDTDYGKAHTGTRVIARRITELHHILHRLRTGSGVNLSQTEEHYHVDFAHLPIDFESFFIWLRIIMDQVAYLTPLFYEDKSKFPSKSNGFWRSFESQRGWFTNPERNESAHIDEKYSKYLKTNTAWFTNARKMRDQATHFLYWCYPEHKQKGKITIKRMRGNRLTKEIDSLREVVGKHYKHFVDFSKCYEQHFTDLLKEREPAFDGVSQDVSTVRGGAASIRYFLGYESIVNGG